MKNIARIGFAAALVSLPCFAGLARAAEGGVEKVSVRAVAHFDFARSGVRPADQGALLADVGKMKDVTWQSVTATGHTDSVGSEAYNQRLSEERAQAVKGYLVGKGLSPEMITAEGKGKAGPIADNQSATGRAKNRRTEIEFQGVRNAAK